MSNFTMKTYKDSYLYNNKISNKEPSNPDKRTNEAIRDFITTSYRIEDKKSDAFRGVVEDIKRQQRSSILLTVLLMDNVKLCIGRSELPRAFKVFDAKDSKSGGKPMVFIDVTGLIEMRNGFYVCKKIDVLCAYLSDALVYLLYRYSPSKIMDNSNITIAATDCYVSMFTYIIDYLRIIGYSVNKKKISYFIALFFLHNMMGKTIDDYTKNIAAKTAELSANDIRAFDLYYEDGMFDNISNFIIFLSETFKLKGFTLEVFVNKWIQLFGTGTQYGCELFTSFMVVIMNANSGSYIIKQQQVERCCGAQNMIKISNAVEKAGVTSFDNRMTMSESDLSIYEVHDKNSCQLAEALNMRKNIPADLAFNVNDFVTVESAIEKAEKVIKFYNEARMGYKLPDVVSEAIMTGVESAYINGMNILNSQDQIYEFGALPAVIKTFKKYPVEDKQRYCIEVTINRDSDALRDALSESCIEEKVIKQAISKTISEFREVKNIM